MLDKEFN